MIVMNINHNDLARDLGFFPKNDYVLLHNNPWVAVRYDDIMPIVNDPKFARKYAKKYKDPETGKSIFCYWTASLHGENEEKIILTIDGPFSRQWELTRYHINQSQIDAIMEVYQNNYSKFWSAQNEDESDDLLTEKFHAYVKGNDSRFAFVLDELYQTIKTAKVYDVLSIGKYHFPLRPIRDMIRTCPKKSIRWDASLTIQEKPATGKNQGEKYPVLTVEFEDIIKTRATFKGTFNRDNLTENLRSNASPTIFSWELPATFFTDWPEPETAVPTPEPAEIAPETTPEPDPVETITEIPETTPEPQPEPTETPETAVPTPAKPKPRKRRQPAKKRLKMPNLPKEWTYRTPEWFVPITA